jgi:DNA-binding transcriptional MerR regulator
MTDFGIGRLAQRAGVAVDTVRLASGYRRYGESELKRLRFIRRAKTLGFTLDEIRELLALSAGHDVASVKRRAQAKLVDVEGRIAQLARVRDGLRTLIDACPGHGRADACPILNALDRPARDAD